MACCCEDLRGGIFKFELIRCVMGSTSSTMKAPEAVPAQSGQVAVAAPAAPAPAPAAVKNALLQSKLSSAIKTGVLNLSDCVSSVNSLCLFCAYC